MVEYQYDPANPYYIPDYGGDESASKTRAAIARSEWENYKQRFQPYEEELTEFAQDYDIGQDVREAKENVQRAYGLGQETMERRMARYGQTGGLSDQQERTLGMAEAAASANAANKARGTLQDMQTALLSKGLGEFSITGGGD